jgi:uncharacterized protein YndB with AHSA1/START domain
MRARRPVAARAARGFDASAERVFRAWLDPEGAGRWLFAAPGGRMLRVEIDARVGGRFAIVEQRGDVQAYHGGVYLEIEPPRRLVFSFGVDEALTDAARVSVDIAPLDDEGCELTLTHELPGAFAEQRQRAEQGWRNILAGLARHLV